MVLFPEATIFRSRFSANGCPKRKFLYDLPKDTSQNGGDWVPETGICLATNIPTYSSFNVRIASTIFGQGTRLLFLQNERTYSLWSYLTMMAKQLFNSRYSYSQEMTRFVNEECTIRDGSITSILQRSSKPLGFGSAFVQRYAFNTQSNDTTQSLDSRLIET